MYLLSEDRTITLPQIEPIGQAFRTSVGAYAKTAIRKRVANALIHHEFWVTGAGPMVEIFDDWTRSPLSRF